MEEIEKIDATVQTMKGMSHQARHLVIKELLEAEAIDIPALVSIHASHLQEFKRAAKDDIRKLSEAGIQLARKEIKKLPAIKDVSKRQLHTAFANTLITGGGYFGTEYQKELLKTVDMTEVDMSWYEDCWQLKTVKLPEDKPNDQ